MATSLKGDTRKIDRLARNMRDLSRRDGQAQRAVAQNTISPIKKVWRDQFRDGEGPEGKWARRADGKQPLKSKKIGADLRAVITRGGVLFKSPVKWLLSHHTGMTYAARAVAARQNVMRFNARNKLVKASKFAKLKRGRAVFASAHRVGVRRLPARTLFPSRKTTHFGYQILPEKWGNAVNKGAAAAMRRWHANATKG